MYREGNGMEIVSKEFTCIREGLTIRGKQYFPVDFQKEKKYPAAIVSHGFKGNYAEMEKRCRKFAEIGYVSFCFSFCGGGKTEGDEKVKSDGITTDMTISTEVKDLSTVIDYAVKLPFVDSENVVLMGESQGGFVSGLTAAKYGEKISRLIMIYPALCIPDHARRGCLGGAAYDPAMVPETLDCGVTVLGKAAHEDVVGMDPYLELEPYKGPVLILHGLEDRIVNYSYSIRAKESYGEGQCHLQLIRNMGHGMDDVQFESVWASIRQFLENREEILTIRVIITHCHPFKEDGMQKNNVYFTGYCETKYFQGAVLPEGCDAQEYYPEEGNKLRAEYTLEGLDSRGERCSIHIVNQKDGEEWKPVVRTDSEALSWMNRVDLTAVLEYGEGGPTVRIFADRKQCSH